MNPEETKDHTQSLLEDNLKKALTELLMLSLLSKKEYYVGELSTALHEKSGGVLTIVFPYSALYRLQRFGYVKELGNRNAPDGRRRQYYGITDAGRMYLAQQLGTYQRFSGGVAAVLEEGEV